MSHWHVRSLLFLMTFLFIACSESSSEEGDAGPSDSGNDASTGSDSDSDTDADGDADSGVDAYVPPCEDTDAGFDEEEPGINMMFQMGMIQMLGQNMALAIGSFMPSAREDFDVAETTRQIELDTCVESVTVDPVPSCTTNDDCAPEQQCLPENDPDTGEPIAGTESCVTPRDLMDVGPFTVTGLGTGPITLAYNASQNGGYMATADGTLDPTSVVYDKTYVIRGDGDPAQGLGNFHGSIYIPEALAITSPEPIMSEMGTPMIELTPGEDLHLEWTGSNPEGTITINMSSIGGSISCLARDDGSFDIPADMVEIAGTGGIAFWHMLEVSRFGYGEVCGDGLTRYDVSFIMSVLLNYKKKGESEDGGV